METDIKTVHILYSGEDEQETPVAAFSDQSVAETLAGRLGKFIEGGVSVKEIDADKCEIEVDKYSNQVKIGNTPYKISMHRDGYLFDPWDMLGKSFDEPDFDDQAEHVVAMRKEEIKNPNKEWGVGGTYWGKDASDAIRRADQRRRELFSKFKIPLKRDRDL
ncbi:hypothetical protein LZG74_16830 [Dyadobacter sp. CY327]|uniref:hypothetical protein n=1 Tax=Dyadobacter sp. CY327 TaxID=2907301 RepID=UPI001F38CE44|nr:hypothetical protein [Dyadobacter sp. CY327]MCE7071983.1 hypothetical protein [Dyadobacter sp. CY327]